MYKHHSTSLCNHVKLYTRIKAFVEIRIQRKCNFSVKDNQPFFQEASYKPKLKVY